MSEENKEKYKSKLKWLKITSEFRVSQLIGAICVSIFILIVFHIINTAGISIRFLPRIKKIGVEENMTGYIAVLGAIPTVYLWAVKERKKEQELKNKEQEFENTQQVLSDKQVELEQIKISELNKVYVDAVNQFSKKETVLAGAYALNGLINDWLGLAIAHPENPLYYSTRVEQILGIILTLNRQELQDNAQDQFNTLIVSLVERLSKKECTAKIYWGDFDLSKIHSWHFELSNANLGGAYLKEADLTHADLKYANLIEANLQSAKLQLANLQGVNLTGADLQEADFQGANLKNANLQGANLTLACFIDADLTGADLQGADLGLADLRGANLKNANLKGASYTSGDLEGAEIF